MSGKLLLALALSGEQTIEITSDSCKRFRFRQNDCHICADICPEQAIVLGIGPVITDDCIQCGLCINACPTEVFQSSVNLDQCILDQMQYIYNKQTRPGNSDCVEIHCQEASARGKHSVNVHCLGNIDENVVLGGALMGFDRITCYTGDCRQCHFHHGEELFDTAVALAGDLIKSLGIKAFQVNKIYQEKEQLNDEPLSRRAFFSRIGQQVKQKTVSEEYTRRSSLESLLSRITDSGDIDKHPSPKRQQLRKLINDWLSKRQDQSLAKRTLPWKKMWVEQEKCVACAICVNVCPTGALVKEIRDNSLYRYYSSAACNNCGLCQDACPHSIIHFTDDCTVMDITDDLQSLVAVVPLNSCIYCGETIPVSEGEICTTCRKRQVLPAWH